MQGDIRAKRPSYRDSKRPDEGPKVTLYLQMQRLPFCVNRSQGAVNRPRIGATVARLWRTLPSVGAVLPRIKQRDLTALEVDSVTRHNREIVDPSTRSDEAIDTVTRSDCVESPPLLGDARINRDYAARESLVQLAEPISEDLRLVGVSTTQVLDAFPDLTQRHHAEMEVDVINLGDPRAHVRVPAPTDL